jgi:DNA-binding LacI/PurR family transcriptional regulator
VLIAASELGLCVPEDVSVVGYDNTHLAAVHHISLTTLDQPRRAMGRSAAALLSDRITDPGKVSRLREVMPRLVVRHSTGPAPSDPQG